MPEISRDGVIRRPDDSSKVLVRLTNGPLGAEERHALARSLVRLLPVVATNCRIGRRRRLRTGFWSTERSQVEAESSGRLEVAGAKKRIGGARLRAR